MEEDSYEDYLERFEESMSLNPGGRLKLTEERFDKLHHEYERLIARIDPEDIQLDEWKRFEELRFILLRDEDEEDLFDAE